MVNQQRTTKRQKKQRKNDSLKKEKDSANRNHSSAFLHRKILLHIVVIVLAWFMFSKFYKGNESETVENVTVQQSKETSFEKNHQSSEILKDGVTEKSKDEMISKFLDWFTENGGYISPSVTLREFVDFGGYGLMAVSDNTSNNQHTSSDDKNVLEPLDELYRIPPSIITSAKSVYSMYHGGSRLVHQFQHRLNMALHHYFSSSLVQQDVIIALHLMVECSLGDHSNLRPYLDVLPQDTIPRLDTFSTEELSLLNDQSLSQMAQDSKRSLQNGWNEGNLKSLVLEMSKSAQKQKQAANTEEHTCLDFKSFHKYVSFVSSRAMVLRGTKYLAPLADFMNYAPRNDQRSSQESLSFNLYHNRNEATGDISVRADRSVQAGEQIFEDYGDVDNSLFLEAHGFVPDENPFHCAIIGPDYLPPVKDLHADIFQVLKTLNLVQVSKDDKINIPDICVKMDGTLSSQWGEDFLKIIFLSDHLPEERKLCVNAFKRNDIEFAKYQCTKYYGHDHALNFMLQSGSRKALCNHETSLESDLITVGKLLTESNENKNTLDFDNSKKILALKFRVSDKHILSRIANVKERNMCAVSDVDQENIFFSQHTNNQITNTLSTTTTTTTTTTTIAHSNDYNDKLIRFNEFLSKLDIPLKKIKPHYFGDGMRLGAITTEDLESGDPYISINDNSVMSVDTAFAENHPKKHRINQILERFRSNPTNGGFHALLLYLLHETFVMKEKSFWFPYISLLPTVDDLKESSPLFLSEDKLELLAVSDLRSTIIRYQRKVADEYHLFFNDIDIVNSLARDTKLDFEKFKWAYSIIDTRSIWWDGKRHLVPLLDLVNCNEVYDEENKTPNKVHETFQDTKNIATTKASYSVSKGKQIFENYGQPDHIYFLYHGFTLQNNSHNCMLLNESIDRGDPGASNISSTKERLNLNGFGNSFSKSFCILDKTSLNDLANYLRIKQGISGGDNTGLQNDVFEIVNDLLSSRLARHEDLASSKSLNKGLTPIEKQMKGLVKQEEIILVRLIDEIQPLK